MDKNTNKLKIAKRQLECLELFPADGGFIVKKRFRWQDTPSGVALEKEPDPVIFSSDETNVMSKYIIDELSKR